MLREKVLCSFLIESCAAISTADLERKEERTYRFKPEQYFKVITERPQSPLAMTAII